MNILETILIFVVAPGAIFVVSALLTLVPGRAKARPKFRAGESWDHPPQLWAGDAPVIIGSSEHSTELGGARGTW